MGFIDTLEKIFRGTTADDNTGTNARDGAQMFNSNMDKIDSALAEIDTAAEKKSNKVNNLDAPNSTQYTTSEAVSNAVSGIQAAAESSTDSKLLAYQKTDEKGQADGYAPLDATGLVPTANLPAYVEEIVEGTYIDSTTFNDDTGTAVTPETNRIYVDTTDSKVYRWGGSVYTEIVASPGTTDDVPEGTVNKYFTAERVRTVVLTGYSVVTGFAVTATDTILAAIGKLQGQINTLTTSLGNKLEKGGYTGTAQDLKTLIDGKETPLGAQSKADAAETNAKDYANSLLKQGIAARYADTAAMIADQANQEDRGVFFVTDASADATVDAGGAYYEYKGTTVGDLTDYRKLSEEESMDVDHSTYATTADLNTKEDALGNPATNGYILSSDSAGNRTWIAPATGGSSTPPANYADVAALFADQANQVENEEYTVADASGWSTITSGWATFQKKATSTASDSDYEKRENQEQLEEAGNSNTTESIGFAVSDEDTALVAGTGKLTFRMPYAFNLTAVRANVKTAPTGSSIIVDINESGSSILSTKISIDVTEKTSTTAATAAVISDGSLADDAEITIDIDQVGSTIAGSGLKLWLIGTKI